MQKTFKVAFVRELLNELKGEKITFSRFVEILNEEANKQPDLKIQKLDNNLQWFEWLSQHAYHGLNEGSTSDAIRSISNKLNEVIDVLNTKR